MNLQQSKQFLFNTAYAGLANQQAWSVSDCPLSNSLYRGINNTKCPIGFLIPDEKYLPHFEDFKPSNIENLLEIILPENNLNEHEQDDLLFFLDCMQLHGHDLHINFEFNVKYLAEFGEFEELTIPDINDDIDGFLGVG